MTTCKQRQTLLSDEFSRICRQARIVPRLANQGLHVASESTLYRLVSCCGPFASAKASRPISLPFTRTTARR